MGYEKWEDPMLISENVLPARSSFMNEEKQSLNGTWQFMCASSPETSPKEFYQKDYDTSAWDSIEVPCCWETKGYGRPYYFGMGFPSAISTEQEKIPCIDHVKTYVGLYKRTFQVPEEWQSEKVILCFESVKAAFYCWINGQYVGMGKGSMLPVEFDITELVQPGENTICVQVYQFSDVIYLENQDMWLMSGIYRDVTVYTQPKKNIYDVYAYADLDEDYRNAKLQLEVTTENAEGTSIRAELIDHGKIIISDEKHLIGDSVDFSFHCLDVKKWTAETPNLYQIRVILMDSGKEDQRKIIDFGFRKIEIKNAELLLNGMPLKLRGINYHAFTPDQGYYVAPEVCEHDLSIMKQNNINAIRTSHYPQDSYFYELCNKYGIYVMDECNVETHGVRDFNVPGDNPVWTAHVVDRMQRMVLRDRNHPCVIIWSLGNESSIGTNHYKMKEAALALDNTRKFHYEPGSDLQISDFICIGYSSPEREQLFADHEDVPKQGDTISETMIDDFNMSLTHITYESYKNNPIVATEYMHCMGNNGTDMEKHMEVFENSPNWCGGFIWDFKDKSLYKGQVNGKTFNAYGGDFGPEGHSKTLCCNGAVNWDGVPHEQLYEIKKAYQSMAAKKLDDRTVQITNRNSFVNQDSFDCNWELSKDDLVIEKGILKVNIPPRSTGDVSIPYKNDMAEAGEYFLTISFTLPTDMLWGKKGTEIAYEQWLLKEEVRPVIEGNDGIKGSVTVGETDEQITVGAGEVTYIVSKKNGNIDHIIYRGKNQLINPLRPSFYRAKTDSELGFMGLAMGKDQDMDFWSEQSIHGLCNEAKINVKNEKSAVITVINELEGTLKRIYTITPDGKLLVHFEITPATAPLRIGMQAEFDREYDQFTWFGKGLHDTYWGREFSGKIGRYTKNVKEQDEHARPHEHGNKRDVRWMTLTNKDGHGMKVEATGDPIAASAWPYTLDELHKAQHVCDLPDHNTTTLNIDCIQNGLGDSFVKLKEQYKIQAGTKYEYDFMISII